MLAAGISSVTGQFEPHSLVSLVDSIGTEISILNTCANSGNVVDVYDIARGITTYGSDEILKIKGLHSTKISKLLGFSRGDTVVHCHNLILI